MITVNPMVRCKVLAIFAFFISFFFRLLKGRPLSQFRGWLLRLSTRFCKSRHSLNGKRLQAKYSSCRVSWMRPWFDCHAIIIFFINFNQPMDRHSTHVEHTNRCQSVRCRNCRWLTRFNFLKECEMNHSERTSTQLSNNKLYSASVHFHQMVFPNIGVARWLIHLIHLRFYKRRLPEYRRPQKRYSVGETEKKMLLPYLRGLKGFNNKLNVLETMLRLIETFYQLAFFPSVLIPLTDNNYNRSIC